MYYTENKPGPSPDDSDGQPAGDSDLSLSIGVNLVSSHTLEERTELETGKECVDQELERDAAILQQPASEEADSVPAEGRASKQPPGLTPKQNSCEEEEKQDQSKEEPPLEKPKPEGGGFRHNAFLQLRHLYLFS